MSQEFLLTEAEKAALIWIQNLQDEAYERGYKDAEKYYTNSCFSCGYAGEWSTWICDDCKNAVRDEELDWIDEDES